MDRFIELGGPAECPSLGNWDIRVCPRPSIFWGESIQPMEKRKRGLRDYFIFAGSINGKKGRIKNLDWHDRCPQ
jgi:hypothetical protein